jgi:dihydroorotase
MNQPILIRNANIANEGQIYKADVFIQNEIIEKVCSYFNGSKKEVISIDAGGKYLFPGVIDTQMHFW